MNTKRSKLVLYTVVLILVGVTAAVVVGLDFYRENLKQKEEAAAAAKLESKIKLHNIQKRTAEKHSSNSVPSKKASPSKQPDEVQKARQAAAEYIGSKDAGVYCIQLNSGKSFGINQDKIYYGASTAKLPDILYTQKKLNEGAIKTNTQFQYHDYVNNIPGAMVRGGTGVLKNNLRDGQLVSVGQLLKYACSYSDNLASNMLGYYVCDKNGGDFKNYIGSVISKNIAVFSKDFSARDTALLMKAIYDESSSGSGQAISYLQHTNWDTAKIPKYIPVKVAHKIGINGSYNHDVAVVYGNNPYVISIMTNGESDEFISRLSKKIYDVMN